MELANKKLFVLVGLAFLALILAALLTFSERKHVARMKCNDPDINEPKIADFDWNLLLPSIGTVIASIMIIIHRKKQNSADGFWYGLFVFLCPLFVVTIGLNLTAWLVQLISVCSGFTAPNFIAACQPDNVNLVCDAFSNRYVIVNCTTPRDSWVPASSAFPSTISTVQAFVMFFLILYIGYRIKNESKPIHFVVGLIGFLSTWATGCIVINRNEATISAVLVGYLIGIVSATISIKILKLLEKEMELLPRFLNDPTQFPTSAAQFPNSDPASDPPLSSFSNLRLELNH